MISKYMQKNRSHGIVRHRVGAARESGEKCLIGIVCDKRMLIMLKAAIYKISPDLLYMF